MRSGKREALSPLLASPVWLCLAGLFVTLGAYLIQISSGISPRQDIAPIDLSSSIVAATACAWTLLQLRSHRAEIASRRAWIIATVGLVILCFEDSVGDWLTLKTQGLREMSISIALWSIAAVCLFVGARRFAFRRYVMDFLWLGLALQIVSQAIGFGAALEIGSEELTDTLKMLNDTGELMAVLAYLAALLLAEFAPVKSYGFSRIFRRGPSERAPGAPIDGAIDLDGYRRARNSGRG